MKLKRSFTLIELLIVVGIIALLAGLITPAVITAQQKGRITQAKSDMHTILMAIKGLESTYGKILNNTGSASSPEFAFANGKAKFIQMNHSTSGVTYQWVAMGPEKDANGGTIRITGQNLDEDAQEAYDSFIAELSDPKNNGFTTANLNVNKRRQVFLDPKPEYDPSRAYDHDDNLPHLWRDPWGNRYIILANTNFTGAVANPADTVSGGTRKMMIGSSAAVISLGPNGVWDTAKNTDVDFCSPDALDDDIASWHK